MWTSALICIRSKYKSVCFMAFKSFSWSQGCPLGKNWGNIHKWTMLATIKMFDNKNHRPRVKIRGRNLCLSKGEIGEIKQDPRGPDPFVSGCLLLESLTAGWLLSQHCCVRIDSWKTLVCSEGSQVSRLPACQRSPSDGAKLPDSSVKPTVAECRGSGSRESPAKKALQAPGLLTGGGHQPGGHSDESVGPGADGLGSNPDWAT